MLFIKKYGAPGETRTPSLLIRSQVLYPIELRAPFERAGGYLKSPRLGKPKEGGGMTRAGPPQGQAP
jgi:hypothetical protein